MVKRDDTFAPPRPGPASIYPQKLKRIAKLKPGIWREVSTFDSVNGATTVLFKLRNDPTKVPNGIWEFSVERDGDSSRLMVRYQGEAKTPDIWWFRAGRLVNAVPTKESKAKSRGAKKRKPVGTAKGQMTEEQKRRAKKRARG